MAEFEKDIKDIKEYIKELEKAKELNPKALNEIELGNTPENLELFDKCTLENHNCGFKTKDGFCLQKDRCYYKLSEKYFNKPEISTVEYILKLLSKRALTRLQILAITPINELRTVKTLRNNKIVFKTYIVDSKGYIFDLDNLKLIASPIQKKKAISSQ